MKKNIIYLAMAAVALTAACTQEDPQNVPDGNGLQLTLQYDGVTETRATAGVGLENTVTSVDYFFYTDVTENAVYSYRDENPTLTDGKYTISFTAGWNGMPDLDVLFNNKKSEFFAVFNAPTALANAPLADVKATVLANTFAHEGTEAGTSTGSKWVVTQDAEAGDFAKYFVMTGQQTLVRDGNVNVSGTVDMKRVAAKVGIDLKIKKAVVDTDGKTWEPMLEGNKIRLYLQNAAGSAVLGGADEAPTFPENLNQFTYKEVYLDCAKATDSGDSYLIENQQDFYTFPMEWTPGGDEEPFVKIIVPWMNGSSEKEIYYKVMIPTTKMVANTYYKMTVNVAILGTEGEPEVTLEPLSAQVVGWQGGGSVNSVVSAAKYLAVEKGLVDESKDIDERVDFYTATSGTEFSASDPVTITIIDIWQKNLTTQKDEYLYKDGKADEAQITKRGYTLADIGPGKDKWIEQVGNYLQIGHQLNSDLTSPLMDVTEYHYKVKLSLPTDIDPTGEYSKTVYFIQYPEVYVLEDPNSNNGATVNSGVFVNGSNSKGVLATGTDGTKYYSVNDPNLYNRGYEYKYNYRNYTSNYSYTTEQRTGYYNGYKTTSFSGQYYSAAYHDGFYHLGGANGISSSASNKNPNMYLITVSVSSKYIIGDPRTSTVDADFIDGFYSASGEQAYDRNRTQNRQAITYNNSNVLTSKTSNWVSAPRTYETSNGILSNYHPASSENTDNMIAPQIRIASSYGVSNVGRTRKEAEYRCASYQEDGIPAGRWRLPTYAEVEFIASLSKHGRIPYLFGSIVRDEDGEAVLDENGNQQGLDDDSYYWTANGLVHINNGQKIVEAATSDPDNQESVRCVYDEWFWGDATTRPVNKTTFTWGDRNY